MLKNLAPQEPTLNSWEVADSIFANYFNNTVKHKIGGSALSSEANASRTVQMHHCADVLRAPVSPELHRAFEQQLKYRGLKALNEIIATAGSKIEPTPESRGCLSEAFLVVLLVSLSFFLCFFLSF